MRFEKELLEKLNISLIDGDRGKNYPTIGELKEEGCCLFLSAKNITKEGFQLKNKQFITLEKDNLLGKGKLSRNDLIITTRGTIGNIAIYDESVPFKNIRINSGMLIIRPSSKSWDHKFLYYVFKSFFFQSQINSLISGSAVPQLPNKDIKKLQIPKAPLFEQKKIAHILSSLDKKIELNNQINQTLEEMAQALFKSWFVDFDPVRAKMRGEQPVGMDAETAALFPDKLVDSELGEIPEGWGVKQVKDICEKIQNGGTPRRNIKENWKNGTISWLSSGEIHSNIIIETKEKITEQGLSSSAAKYIPKLTTLIALYGATAGKVAINSKTITTNQAVCNLIASKNYKLYMYFSMKSIENILPKIAVGSAQQNLSKKIIEEIKIKHPDLILINKFNSLASKMLKLKISKLKQNQTLTQIRDTLLPKLLSGEIKLK